MKTPALSLILVLIPITVLQAGNEHTAESSVNIMMDLNIDSKNYEETRDRNVQDVRLYTSEMRTLVVWSNQRDYFVYILKGDNHLEEATALLEPIARGEMISYVFEREPQKSVKYSRYFRVIGLQIRPNVPKR